jgi:DNA end-binding protein Ku
VLVLNTMLWPDEVRTPDFEFLGDDIEAKPAELAMAGSLIESMAAEFNPDEYTDNYRAALQEVIDAKVAGREVVQPEEPEAAPSAAVDLMAALRASVERARSARGEEPAGESASEPTPISSAKSAQKAAPKAAPAKKAPAKKAPAKKATAAKKATTAEKKTPAKKTAAKKSA